MQNWARTFSPLCPVFFAGFESNTYQLQREGWQLAYEHAYGIDGIRLALKHEKAGLYALTVPVAMSAVHAWRHGDHGATIPFHVQYMGSNARLQIIPVRTSMKSWNAFDATPEMCWDVRELTFDELIPFRPLSADAPEIVIPQGNVSELLALALQMQDPKQKEIRERQRKQALRDVQSGAATEGYDPRGDIRAQIITLAG